MAGRGRGLAGQSSVTNRPRRRLLLLLPHPCHGRGRPRNGSRTVTSLIWSLVGFRWEVWKMKGLDLLVGAEGVKAAMALPHGADAVCPGWVGP